MSNLIKLNKLAVYHGTKTLLEPISLELHPQRPMTILGQTGAGKSLLLQAIMGCLPQTLSTSGEVAINGTIVPYHQRYLLWGKQLALLPQEPCKALDPLMNVYQQVAEVYQDVKAYSEYAAIQQSLHQLAQLGLLDATLKKPEALSGGMAQRLSLLCSTAAKAPLLLADEPTKGLDAKCRDTIIQRLQQQQRNGGLLTITHDLEVAKRLAGEIIVIQSGKVVERGDTAEVLTQAKHPYTQALIAAQAKNWPTAQHQHQHQHQTKPLLSAKQLVVARNGRALTPPLNFVIGEAEVVGISGPSGVGKSSLGDTLLGLLKPLSGQVKRHLEQTHQSQWLKLYQDPPAALESTCTLGTLLNDLRQLQHIPWHQVTRLMQQLQLDPQLLQQTPDKVSGGELQRFSILRALLLRPRFLFADEPISRLDPLTGKSVLLMLVDLAKQHRCALMLVSHDPMILEKLCDKVIDLGN